jgi:hypothetical protein
VRITSGRDKEVDMAELIVMVCLLATPEKCQEFKVEGLEYRDVVTCIRTGGEKSDEWQEENNNYFVIGWRCAKDTNVPVAPKS